MASKKLKSLNKQTTKKTKTKGKAKKDCDCGCKH